MIQPTNTRHRFLYRLRRNLPAYAHARQPLLRYLQSKRIVGSSSPTLRIANVFLDSGENIMCQFQIDGDTNGRFFVVPLTQLALDRRHPAAREAAKAVAPRRRRFCAAACS